MQVHFVVLIHGERNLFYICTHDVNSKTQKGWKNVALKAKSAYNNIKAHNIDGCTIAMVNTNYSGWADIYVDGTFNKENDEYLVAKQDLIDAYEEQGFIYVGKNLRVSNGPGNGTATAMWNSTFNVSNMTRKKILEKINFINLSMQRKISQSLINLAYLEVVTDRQTYGFKVDSMSSLLRFMRTALSIDDVVENKMAA